MLKKADMDETQAELDDIEGCLSYCTFFLLNIADVSLVKSLSIAKPKVPRQP